MSVSHIVFITQMFQTPGLIAMTIAATRMYRSLTDFNNPEYYVSGPVLSHANRCRHPRLFDSHLSRMGRTAIAHPKAPVAVGRVEVAVHTFSEGYPPAMTGQCTSYGSYSAGGQPQDNALEPGISSDLENAVERK